VYLIERSKLGFPRNLLKSNNDFRFSLFDRRQHPQQQLQKIAHVITPLSDDNK